MTKHNRVQLSLFKLSVGLLGFSAIVTEIATLIERGVFNPANFFSFFTIQSNILVVISFLLSALYITSSKPPKWLHTFRAATTVYILIVGIGFALLLSGLDSIVFAAVPWDNIVLHYIIPVAAVIDLVIDKPNIPSSVRRNISWLIFPVIYSIYTFSRGSITGWYPYPFLDPSVSSTIEIMVAVGGIVALGMLLIFAVTKYSRS